MPIAQISPGALQNMRNGGVYVPATLMIDGNLRFLEGWQTLQTIYWLESGASTVIPGAHTGQFALGDIQLYKQWLDLTRKVMEESSQKDRLFYMAAVSGENAMNMAKAAAEKGYDLVMVAPSAFKSKSEEDSIAYLRQMAEIIPIFGFYLQEKVGGREFSEKFWNRLYEFAVGAKIAPFDRQRTDVAMNAAANSDRHKELVMATGNDDNIVDDFLTTWHGKDDQRMRFDAGLLGHFAVDTHAAVKLVEFLKRERANGQIVTSNPTLQALAEDVTKMNYALFDTRNNFANSVYGVEFRQSMLGLAPQNRHVKGESGSSRLEQEIEEAYRQRVHLTDDAFVKDKLQQWKRMAGVE